MFGVGSVINEPLFGLKGTTHPSFISPFSLYINLLRGPLILYGKKRGVFSVVYTVWLGGGFLNLSVGSFLLSYRFPYFHSFIS